MHIDTPFHPILQSKYGSKLERVQEAAKKQGGVPAKLITFKPILHTDDVDENLDEGLLDSIDKSNI